ncbi:MAG: addiction module protein [Sulfurimonas sp.]|nr:addiction module protein [Sulfurimonas sp.]
MSILEDVLILKPVERLHLIDALLLSLDVPTKEVDIVWMKEVEKRVEAYNRGELNTTPSNEVFAKYKL